MGGPKLRPAAATAAAAAALLLLSAAALCAGQPQGVTVRTVVQESFALRTKFPQGWTVPANLQRLIPEFMRGDLTRVYRGSMPYADMAKVCTNLGAKKSVTLVATKKKLSERVQVLAATPPCSTGKGITPLKGGFSPATFLVLVKRFNAEPENSYTVLRCVKGSADCILYRLAPPCFGGICKITPDPSILSSVFSDIPIPLAEPGDEVPQEILETVVTNLDDPTVLEETTENVAVFYGALLDNPDAVKYAKTAVGDAGDRLKAYLPTDGTTSSARAADATTPDKVPVHDAGFTKFALDTTPDFGEYRMTNVQPGAGDDEDVPDDSGGSTSAVALSTAAVYGLAESDFVGIAAVVDMGPGMPPVKDQGSCPSSWVHATLTQVEVALKKKYPDLPPEEFQLSAQHVLDCTNNIDCKSGADMNKAIDYIIANALHLHSSYDYDSANHGEVTNCMTDDIEKMFTTDDEGEDDSSPASGSASAAGAEPAACKCDKKCKKRKDPCSALKKNKAAYKKCLKTHKLGKAFLRAGKKYMACLKHNKRCPKVGCKKTKKAKINGKKGKKTKQANNKLHKKKNKKSVTKAVTANGRRLLQAVEIPERQAILKAVLNKGIPIYVTLSGNVLQDYRGGAVNPKFCSANVADFNHAAVLVGFDDKGWKLQNSMGADHGLNGFFWLAMTEDQEYGPCGLYFNTMWVDIDPDEIELTDA